MNKKLLLSLSAILIANFSLPSYASDNLVEVKILSFENNSVKFFNYETTDIKPEEKVPNAESKKEIDYAPALFLILFPVALVGTLAFVIATSISHSKPYEPK